MYCKSCGKEMNENEVVCSKCGTSVECGVKIAENSINGENNYDSNINNNNYDSNMNNNNSNLNNNNYDPNMNNSSSNMNNNSSNMNNNNYNPNMSNNNYNPNMNNNNYSYGSNINYVRMYTDPKTNCTMPEQYKPIGAWAYLGWNILFAIPCIGFILILVFALSGSNNINLRNYARSYLCVYLILAIIALIIFIISLFIGAHMVDPLTAL